MARRFGMWLGLVALCGSSLAIAQSTGRDVTDVRIRRLAGLPAESARGQIEILDVGHHPMDTMLSIVARRTATGWSVSYVCAESPACAEGSDHLAKAYSLSAADAARVDSILTELRRGAEPDGQKPSRDIIGGWLAVTVDDAGFKRTYHREMQWGRTLGTLEQLLMPPARGG